MEMQYRWHNIVCIDITEFIREREKMSHLSNNLKRLMGQANITAIGRTTD